MVISTFVASGDLSFLREIRCAPPSSYVIEAFGYESVVTNGFAVGRSSQKDLSDNLGEIQLEPK